jgi:ATP-dependent Clp protease ATP-binding subunit ClpB
MTSNIGGQLILDSKRQKNLDQEALHNQILGLLKQSFRPEFLNRVDDVVIFNFLGKKQISQIFEIQIRRLNKNLGERKLSLTVSDQARNKILSEGFDPEYGVRPLKRTIQRELENPLALAILQGQFKEGDSIVADLGDEMQIVFFPESNQEED